MSSTGDGCIDHKHLFHDSDSWIPSLSSLRSWTAEDSFMLIETVVQWQLLNLVSEFRLANYYLIFLFAITEESALIVGDTIYFLINFTQEKRLVNIFLGAKLCDCVIVSYFIFSTVTIKFLRV